MSRTKIEDPTPAPWWVCDGQIIQTTHITRDIWVLPRNLADMRLMAAAPELLEALRHMLAVDTGEVGSDRKLALTLTRAAIAKAESGSP